MEVSQENYKRFNGRRNYQLITNNEKDYIIRDIALTANVEFRKLNINFDNAPQNVKLILFRNSLIYYNPTHQEYHAAGFIPFSCRLQDIW